MSAEETKKSGWTDEQVDAVVGHLLRTGVLLSGFVVLLGGILYLAQPAGPVVDHHKFHGEPAALRSPRQIVADALTLDSRGIIQFGLLLLVATPVARVGFMLFAFLRQRDFLYVAVTLIVLAVLLFSMFGAMP